jgi:hypothetical protein
VATSTTSGSRIGRLHEIHPGRQQARSVEEHCHANLHAFDCEQKQMLIARAYDSLPEGGALLIYEALIDDERRTNTFGLLFSLHMLVATPGGADYTGAEACVWLRTAGFREVRVEHLTGTDWMVVGIK